jgi:hypothetical protein
VTATPEAIMLFGLAWTLGVVTAVAWRRPFRPKGV